MGSLAALAWLLVATREKPPLRGKSARMPSMVDALDSGLVVLLGGLVAARAGYVLLHANFFAGQPALALALWEGGLAGWAALLGAVPALALFCHWRGVDFWSTSDLLAMPATLLAVALWMGCLVDGCAYGRPLPPSPLALQGYDVMGVLEPRWPVQSLGALASALSLVPLRVWSGRRAAPGTLGLLALAIHSAVALMLTLIRADPMRQLGALRLDTLAWAVMFGLSSLGFGLRQKRE